VQGTKIFLNGKWIGIHRNPDELKSALLKLRRMSMSITEDVSIVYDHALGEMRVYNDWGRVCRPLYVVENSSIKIVKGDIKLLQVRAGRGQHALPWPCPEHPPLLACHGDAVCLLHSLGPTRCKFACAGWHGPGM
jgi:DNA-directed RNA polymerase II subunit RPB2